MWNFSVMWLAQTNLFHINKVRQFSTRQKLAQLRVRNGSYWSQVYVSSSPGPVPHTALYIHLHMCGYAYVRTKPKLNRRPVCLAGFDSVTHHVGRTKAQPCFPLAPAKKVFLLARNRSREKNASGKRRRESRTHHRPRECRILFLFLAGISLSIPGDHDITDSIFWRRIDPHMKINSNFWWEKIIDSQWKLISIKIHLFIYWT